MSSPLGNRINLIAGQQGHRYSGADWLHRITSCKSSATLTDGGDADKEKLITFPEIH